MTNNTQFGIHQNAEAMMTSPFSSFRRLPMEIGSETGFGCRLHRPLRAIQVSTLGRPVDSLFPIFNYLFYVAKKTRNSILYARTQRHYI